MHHGSAPMALFFAAALAACAGSQATPTEAAPAAAAPAAATQAQSAENSAQALGAYALRRQNAARRSVTFAPGDVSVEGPVAFDRVLDAVALGSVDVKACYDAALGIEEPPLGFVTVRLRLAESGAVDEVAVSADELALPKLAPCLEPRAERWSLPAASGASRIEARFEIRATGSAE